MKKLLIFYMALFCFLEIKSQEDNVFFVDAPSGLVVREQADLHSLRIGKLPYGTLVEVLETTENREHIVIDGETKEGVWVKVKYAEYPFVMVEDESRRESEEWWNREGFVFNGYLERLRKASVSIEELDSVAFYAVYVKPIPNKLPKIQLVEDIEKYLSPNVKGEIVDFYGQNRYVIKEIQLENGQLLPLREGFMDEMDVVAYYPTEEIILFEGGHTSDFSISVRTGEALETTGNPEYIVESPNQKIRLNGWFPGQECSSYFFQEIVNDRYRFLVEFGWGTEYGGNVCYFDQFSWLNDSAFVYSRMDYSEAQGVKRFYRGKITVN